MSDEVVVTPAPQSAPSRGAHSLVMLFAVLGGVAMMILLVIGISTFGRPGGKPAPVMGKAEGERFAISSADDLAGTDLLRIGIATERSIGRGNPYSGGDSVDTRNLILLDKASGESRKLLPDNMRQIVDEKFLPAAVEVQKAVTPDGAETTGEATKQSPPPPPAYYLLRVRIGKGPTEDVLLGDIKSGRQAFVLTNIDGVDRVWMQTPTRIAMLMRQGRKLQYRAFDLPELRLAISRPIEID